jgi:hypothetical protein
METYECFSLVDNIRAGAVVIGRRWVMGTKRMANGKIDQWKVRLVSRGDHRMHGDYNDIIVEVIDSASIRFALGLAAKHILEIAIHDLPTALLGYHPHESHNMRLPDGRMA